MYWLFLFLGTAIALVIAIGIWRFIITLIPIIPIPWVKTPTPQPQGQPVIIVPVPKKSSAWKTTLMWAAVILLCLAFLPQLVGAGKWALTWVVSGPDELFRGTPRHEWGIGSHPVQPIISQGKNVGGPLRWSNDAKVRVRSRINQENLDDNRSCFVGVIPPASWMDTTFVTYSEGVASWKAFLVDRTSMRNLPSSGVLNNRASLKERVRDVAMVHLPGLTNGREEKRLENTLPQSASRVVECYVQFDGGPTALHLDIKEPSDTFQYELEVGPEAVQITGLPQSFKWLWIAPVHHGGYQSYFFDRVIPSSGIPYREALAIVQANEPILQEYLQLPTKRFQEDLPFQAILLERDGATSVLSEAVLLQQGDVKGSSISLRLNVPNDESVSRLIKPAKIIIGIQL